MEPIQSCILRAYRGQYIGSGVQNPRFGEVLGKMINEAQGAKIGAALAPIFEYVNAH